MDEICISIKYGLYDWQILQQKDGYADITIGGSYWYDVNEEWGAPTLYCFVQNENTGAPVPVACESRLSGGKRGTWEAKLRLPTGGLYSLVTRMEWYKDGYAECICRWYGEARRHIGVGDVFLIAGQSNASGTARSMLEDAPDMLVHVFRDETHWDIATHPFNQNYSMHSPWLAFAKQLRAALNYPIGLIQTARGGSQLAEWHLSERGGLYRNMLSVVEASGASPVGVLWYQGCSDTGRDECETYLARFKETVADFREGLKNPTLPFLTCQLNRFRTLVYGNDASGWNAVRNAQRIAAETIDGVYVTSTIDLNMSDEIHNSRAGNLVLGERVAQLALSVLYGRKDAILAPDIDTAVYDGDRTVTIGFKNVTTRLGIYYATVEQLPFTVSDGEGEVAVSAYRIYGNTVVLTLMRPLAENARLSIGEGLCPQICIYDEETHYPALCVSDFPITRA